MPTQPATAAIIFAAQAAPAAPLLFDWVSRHWTTLAATLAFGAAGGGVVVALSTSFIKNSLAPELPPPPADEPDIPAADYWEFVYGAVKAAEASGDSGATRMAHYMDAVDKFLDECGVHGDGRRVHAKRLRSDAEFALRALGFNRGTTQPPIAS